MIATGPDFEKWAEGILAQLPPLTGEDAAAVGRVTAVIDARRQVATRKNRKVGVA